MPAFGYLWLNRLYDPLVGATMPERRIKTALIGAARAVPGSRVLDVGCEHSRRHYRHGRQGTVRRQGDQDGSGDQTRRSCQGQEVD